MINKFLGALFWCLIFCVMGGLLGGTIINLWGGRQKSGEIDPYKLQKKLGENDKKVG
ncbi:MAG: hypothetical protein ACOCZR_00830 [Halanaerobiales bacterium]